MNIHGMPEQFWVVTRPTEVSELGDICFACDFGGLLTQIRGGLTMDDIVGIYVDEDTAQGEARRLLGECVVRPQDSVFFEVVVHVMGVPKSEEMTAKELGQAAVEAVANAVHLAEERGHQHRLGDRAVLGMSEVVELKGQIVAYG